MENFNNLILDFKTGYNTIIDKNLSNINSVFGKAKNLDTLLDELLEQEDDINSIVFDAEHETIYEQEVPLNIDIIESYKEAITDDDIRVGLNNSNKKIGSSLQRCINVFELYQSNSLIFRHEAIDLAELIINKLIAYQNIIIDFDKIETITEAFLRGAFDILTKFWTVNDILQNIEIINIDDEIYVSLIKDIIPNASKYWASNTFQLNTDIEKLELLRQLDPSSELLLDEPEKLTARELGHMVHSHPTISEMVLEAVEDVYGMAIHKAGRPKL